MPGSGAEQDWIKRGFQHAPGLYRQPVGAASAESVGSGSSAAALHRDVVLGVPVVSLLLALRPRSDGFADVRHVAAPQERSPHNPGAGQRGVPGLAVWRRHHQCGGGRGVPCGREGHGAPGGPGLRRGPDDPLHLHLLLPDLGHVVKKRLGGTGRSGS